MKEKVVRLKFPKISQAFCNWENASKIFRRRRSCRSNALKHFRHEQKIDAILSVSESVKVEGFETIKTKIADHGIEYLESFPYIGTVTKFHLGKNLGLDVVKPDRHLCRIASQSGFDSPDQMCHVVHELTGEKLSVIDLVFWRFATLDNNYLDFFSATAKSQRLLAA